MQALSFQHHRNVPVNLDHAVVVHPDRLQSISSSSYLWVYPTSTSNFSFQKDIFFIHPFTPKIPRNSISLSLSLSFVSGGIVGPTGLPCLGYGRRACRSRRPRWRMVTGGGWAARTMAASSGWYFSGEYDMAGGLTSLIEESVHFQLLTRLTGFCPTAISYIYI